MLLELRVGVPPFYTTNIFHLMNLVVKDPVRWPQGMDPTFKVLPPSSL